MKIRIITKRWYTPPWGKPNGITLYPFIFIRPNKFYKNLLRHELIHVVQVRHIGWWKFYLKYLTDKKFRKQMEDMAYHSQNNPQFLPKDLEALIHKTLTGRLHN